VVGGSIGGTVVAGPKGKSKAKAQISQKSFSLQTIRTAMKIADAALLIVRKLVNIAMVVIEEYSESIKPLSQKNRISLLSVNPDSKQGV
jgi:hypothetical protein